jgi:broad specificity phosphatase PhoE
MFNIKIMEKLIYLIRHGETEHNNDRNKFSGISDIPLAVNGKKQCKQLSYFFIKNNVEAVYSSPLNRAVESTNLIFPKVSPIIIDGLKEFNYGDYEGISKEELPKDDPIVIQWQTQPAELTFPKGGSIRQHASNSFSAFHKLIQDSENTTIACVSHKTTIRLIISKIIGLDLNHFRKIPCSNCGINEIHYSEKGFSIASINVKPIYTNTIEEATNGY